MSLRQSRRHILTSSNAVWSHGTSARLFSQTHRKFSAVEAEKAIGWTRPGNAILEERRGVNICGDSSFPLYNGISLIMRYPMGSPSLGRGGRISFENRRKKGRAGREEAKHRERRHIALSGHSTDINWEYLNKPKIRKKIRSTGPTGSKIRPRAQIAVRRFQ